MCRGGRWWRAFRLESCAGIRRPGPPTAARWGSRQMPCPPWTAERCSARDDFRRGRGVAMEGMGRVLLVGDYPPPQGGVAIHVQQLQRYLVRQGLEAKVLNIGKGGRPAPDVLPV